VPLEAIEIPFYDTAKAFEERVKAVRNFISQSGGGSLLYGTGNNKQIKNPFTQAADEEKFILGIDEIDWADKKSKSDITSNNKSRLLGPATTSGTSVVIGSTLVDNKNINNNNNNNNNDEDETKTVMISKPSTPGFHYLFTQTTLRLSDLMTKYLFALQIMRSITVDVFSAFAQLHTFYIYVVHSLFAGLSKEIPLPEQDPNLMEPVKVTFKLLHDNLNKMIRDFTKQETATFLLPKLNSTLENGINKPPNFCLSERVVALETLSVTLQIVKRIAPTMQNYIPKKYAEKFMSDYLGDMEACTTGTKVVILYRLINVTFSMPNLATSIANVKWDNLNIEILDCNKYVAEVLKEFQNYQKKLNSVELLTSTQLMEKMWEIPIANVMDELIEGYSRIKKCDSMGRNLMKYDFNELEKQLKKLANRFQTLPRSAQVREYIDGYHYPQESMQQWVQEHCKDYTKQQIISLINIGPGTRFKSKNELKDLLTFVDKVMEDQKTKDVDDKKMSLSRAQQRKSTWDLMGQMGDIMLGHKKNISNKLNLN